MDLDDDVRCDLMESNRDDWDRQVNGLRDTLSAQLQIIADEVRGDLEAERAEHDMTRYRLRQAERRLQGLGAIEALVSRAEREQMSNYEAMARIRGILHV